MNICSTYSLMSKVSMAWAVLYFLSVLQEFTYDLWYRYYRDQFSGKTYLSIKKIVGCKLLAVSLTVFQLMEGLSGIWKGASNSWLASPSGLCAFGKGTSKETHEPKAFGSCSQLNCCKGVLQGTWFVHFYFSATGYSFRKGSFKAPTFPKSCWLDQLCHCDKGPRQLM